MKRKSVVHHTPARPAPQPTRVPRLRAASAPRAPKVGHGKNIQLRLVHP